MGLSRVFSRYFGKFCKKQKTVNRCAIINANPQLIYQAPAPNITRVGKVIPGRHFSKMENTNAANEDHEDLITYAKNLHEIQTFAKAQYQFIPELFKSSVQQVIPGLFIGSQFALPYYQKLMALGITRVIAANGMEKPPYLPFEFLPIPIDDDSDENISAYFETAIQFIKEAPAGVLVNCTAGISRSATIIAAYLISEHGYTYEQAIATLKEARSITNPNEGFRRQLIQYAEQHSCELCQLEKRTTWLEEHPDFTVLLWEQCDLPMVVLKKHGLTTTPEIASQMTLAISKYGDEHVGPNWRIDYKPRTIFNHLHWHLRPGWPKLPGLSKL